MNPQSNGCRSEAIAIKNGAFVSKHQPYIKKIKG